MSPGRFLGCVGLALALGGISIAPTEPALAQAGAPAGQGQASEAELDRLFDLMLRDPTNLDIMFQYSQVALQLGNYDAAIGTLSRMLLFNPNLPRVRLELGALYFQLGSYPAAKAYITQAMESRDMPADVRARAGALLAEIERRSETSVFSGSVGGGVRWQQNANSGPTGSNVRALGQDATLGESFARQSDWNIFALAQIQHIYKFDNIDQDTLESTAAFYGTRQEDLHTLNVGLAELTTGPRYQLGKNDLGAASWRPYLIANTLSLGDHRYYSTFGTGIGITQAVGEVAQIDVTVERREKRFRNNSERPFASDRDSGETSGLIVGRIRTSEETFISLGGGISDDNARREFWDSTQLSGFGSLTYLFNPGLWVVSQPWTLTATMMRVVTDYDAPDPGVDPDISRSDREWRYLLVGTVPITGDVSLFTQAQRSRVESNLPNFKYNNWAFTSGLSLRF
jgi:hypothetical protein